MKKRIRQAIGFIRRSGPGPLIIALSAYLLLQGLGNNYFWDDEAGTAIFSRNLLRFGKLTAWDGRNLMAYRRGAELDDRLINRYVPPLQFLVTAASFKFLGVSTFSGRLPFALLGVGTLIVFFALLRLESDRTRRFGWVALSLLAFSPSFLLFSRQCRYFSLVIFFPLLSYYCYKKYLSGGRTRWLFGLGGGLLALFVSQYLLAAAFAFALLGTHWIHSERPRRSRPLLLTGGSVALLAALYIILYHVIIPPPPAGSTMKWLADRGRLLVRYLREINAFDWFPWMILPGFLWLARDRGFPSRLKRRAGDWALFSLLFLIFLVLFSPQAVRPGALADTRYLLPLLPFLAGLLGLMVYFVLTRNVLLGVLVLLVLLFTNLFSLNFWFPRKPRYDLIDYLHEIHRPYLSAYEAAANFIRERCVPDEVIIVVPPNMSYPLQFYLGDRVIFGGRTDFNTRLNLDRIRSLNPDFIVEESRPDWIISFRWRQATEELLKSYRQRGLVFELDTVLDVYYLGELSRPEILLHGFYPVRDFDPRADGILFFRRERAWSPTGNKRASISGPDPQSF